MTRDETLQVIYEIMKNKLQLPTLSAFSESSRLNEDLYMDSVMVLQLILHLELDLRLDIPDEILKPNDFHTVATLANFLERLQKEQILEEVHD